MSWQEWALEVRESLVECTRVTGRCEAGAILMARRNPLTGERLSEPEEVPIASMGSDPQHIAAIAQALKLLVVQLDAEAVVLFGPLNSGVCFRFEERGCVHGVDWIARLEGSIISDWTERFGQVSLFTLPPHSVN